MRRSNRTTRTRGVFGSVFQVAMKYGLAVYDAAYLELAIRRALPLATLDKRLSEAARQARVEVLG